MTDSVSEMMFAAAVTLAGQLAVREMERELALARHIRAAMDLVAPVQHLADDTDGLVLEDRGWTR